MPISENARAVLEKRYLIRDENGQPTETVDQLFHRVADAIAAADARFDPKADVAATAGTFYDMMTNLDFLPNSPTLMNAGRPLGQLSACFVLPVADSMEDISTPSRTPPSSTSPAAAPAFPSPACGPGAPRSTPPAGWPAGPSPS